jgi:Rifampin ADP-ribosyl transferase
MAATDHLSPPQFFHGTTSEFKPGDMLSPDGAKAHGHFENNSKGYVHFSEYSSGGADYAEGRAGDYGGTPRVYQVHPTGDYETDPNDMGGSHRSKSPLRVVRELPEDQWEAFG